MIGQYVCVSKVSIEIEWIRHCSLIYENQSIVSDRILLIKCWPKTKILSLPIVFALDGAMNT